MPVPEWQLSSERIGKGYPSVRSYRAESWLQGGVRSAFVIDSPLIVQFEPRTEKTIIHWHAGGNRFGAIAEFSDDMLLLRQIESTQVALQPECLRQDEWLMAFFASGPRVAFAGGVLVLSSQELVIEFYELSMDGSP